MATSKRDMREDDGILLLRRGKIGLMRLLFSRTGVVLVLLAAQALLLAAAFVRLREYYYGSALTASLLTSLMVINRPGDPTVKITWILLFFLLPVFGIPFYFYVNADLGHPLCAAGWRSSAGKRGATACRMPICAAVCSGRSRVFPGCVTT